MTRPIARHAGWGNDVQVFVSWSGTRGRSVAEAIGAWLPLLHEGLSCWVSSRQQRGVDWRVALFEHIGAADAGVLCLTSDSIASRWLSFEAGMLSRHSGRPLVLCTLDVDPDELLGTPFARMPRFEANQDGISALASAINGALPHPLVEAELQQRVAATWPRLDFHLGHVAPRATRPVELTVLIPGVRARYRIELPADRRWSALIDHVRAALSEQYGVPDTDLTHVEYFDLDAKRWIETPRRLSDVSTSRLVAVHPGVLEQLGGTRSSAALVIGIQLDEQPRQARADAHVRRDLLDLVRTQTAFQAQHGAFAADLESLPFFAADGVSIEIVEATAAGWCALASHRELRWRLGIRSGQTESFSDRASEAVFLAA